MKLFIALIFIFFSHYSYSEQVGPSYKGPSGLSIGSYTGALSYERTDLEIPAQGISLNFTFYYSNSFTAEKYWVMETVEINYSMRYQKENFSLTIRTPNGFIYQFVGNYEFGWV